MANTRYMLTTYDNPYDPYDEFDSWYLKDVELGWNTCSYISRLALTSDTLSETENAEEIERVMEDILKYDPFGVYRKAYPKAQTA